MFLNNLNNLLLKYEINNEKKSIIYNNTRIAFIKKNMNNCNYQNCYFLDLNVHRIFKRNMWKISTGKMGVGNKAIVNKVYNYESYKQIPRGYHQTNVFKSIYNFNRYSNVNIKLIIDFNQRYKNDINNMWRGLKHDLIVDKIKDYTELKNGQITEMVEYNYVVITTTNKKINYNKDKIPVVELLKDLDNGKIYYAGALVYKNKITKKEYEAFEIQAIHSEKRELIVNKLCDIVNMKKETFKFLNWTIPYENNFNKDGKLYNFEGKLSPYENKNNKIIVIEEN